MSFLDKFKKGKKEKVLEKTKEKKKEKIEKKTEKVEKKEEKKIEKKTEAPEKKEEKKRDFKLKERKPAAIAGIYRILKSPHITEKATDMEEENKYVFKVYPEANKPEIKKSIENLYGVDVLSVRIIKISPKKRRLGRAEGWRKGYKKAIIKIKEGQKIEILPR